MLQSMEVYDVITGQIVRFRVPDCPYAGGFIDMIAIPPRLKINV
jgi:hypothetical protein